MASSSSRSYGEERERDRHRRDRHDEGRSHRSRDDEERRHRNRDEKDRSHRSHRELSDSRRHRHRSRSPRRHGHHQSSRDGDGRQRDEQRAHHEHRSHRHHTTGSSDDDDEKATKQGDSSSRQTRQDGATRSLDQIPVADSLDLTSTAPPVPLRRDDWMMSGSEGKAGEDQTTTQVEEGTTDNYFASFGTYSRQRPPRPEKPNPDKLHVSSRELNRQFAEGKHIDDYDTPSATPAIVPGGPGSQWRMMKYRRVLETAEQEGRSVEEVALERYGSMEAFREAETERRFLDQQKGGRPGASRHQSHTSPAQSASASRAPSRQSSFRKPGEDASTTSSPAPLLRQDSSKPATPIPTVFAPVGVAAQSVDGTARSVAQTPALSTAALNKLSAKVLRAEMMGAANASELRAQYKEEKARAEVGAHPGPAVAAPPTLSKNGVHLEALPTLDGRGRLYDVGTASSTQASTANGEKRRPDKFETHDPTTGQRVRYNADDDDLTLADLVREEKFGAGAAAQKNMDAQMADRIVNDRAFKGTVDYMDDNVERLGRCKMKSDAMKRMFAVQDYAKTKRALDTCPYCWQDDRPPRAPIVSSGTRTFLALPDTEPLVPGHCLIVPAQHHLSMLEIDEDDWEEVKNFMKCLIRKADAEGKEMLFYETVTSLRHQKHTLIEALPIEKALLSQLPGYFRQSILQASDEWGQNKGLIEFTPQRPFRRSMVPNLPYFMVQFDVDGTKGYGHVIEERDGGRRGGASAGDGEAEDGYGDLGHGNRSSGLGGGEFPRWFAAEIVGTLLDYEPRRWRKPRRLQGEEIPYLLDEFRSAWTPYDWTSLLDKPGSNTG